MIVYSRKGTNPADTITVVLNMTPVPRGNYRIGVQTEGNYHEILNTDAKEFWGSGVLNEGPIMSETVACHGQKQSVQLNLPPLAAVILKVK